MNTLGTSRSWQVWLTRAILTVALTLLIRIVVAILDGADLPVVATRIVGGVIGVAALVGLGRIRWLETARNGLRPPQPARGWLLGALTGALVYSAIVLVAGIAGWYTVQSARFDLGALLTGFALLLAAAAFEEILFRGVLFQPLEGALGTGWALGLSGALFGALHLGNANASLTGAVAVGVAGVALGALYAWTRDLWLLTGLHVMWNFMQGPIYGVAVSGNSFGSALQPRIEGPALFTGGAFGFEAGALTIALCVGTALWLIGRTQQSGRWIPSTRG